MASSNVMGTAGNSLPNGPDTVGDTFVTISRHQDANNSKEIYPTVWRLQEFSSEFCVLTGFFRLDIPG
jgi:hypothetical protein